MENLLKEQEFYSNYTEFVNCDFFISQVFPQIGKQEEKLIEEKGKLQKFRSKDFLHEKGLFFFFSLISVNKLFNYLYVLSLALIQSSLYLQKSLSYFLFPVFEKAAMSHQVQADQNEIQSFKQAQACTQKLGDPSLPPKVQIQPSLNKKKQVIDLDSPVEEEIKVEKKTVKNSERPTNGTEKNPKVKKILLKCQLCKSSGKKVEMKTCISCKNYFHLACLQENELKKKFCCEKCRAQQVQQSKVTKKMKKQEQKIQKAQNDKATIKKIEKQRKRQDNNKTYQKFQEKYPYYIGDNSKIKFPIEDKLLFIYKDYFQPSQNKPFPVDHPLIPSQYLGDLLEIQNFIVSFLTQIQKDYNGQYKKSVLYLHLNCNGSDRVFQQLLGTIIKIYLKDIYEKNKTENVKILNDNCFFILLGTFTQNEQLGSDVASQIAPEIIRNLATVPSMKQAFQQFTFPQKLNLRTKIKTLISLIQGLSQVDGFHNMVSRKSEKISQLTKTKAEFVNKLKKNQAEALSNKQKIKQIQGQVNQMQKEQNGGNQQQKNLEKNKKSKQVQKAKKKTQKLQSQGQQSQKVIKQIRSKIVNISRNIPFTISQVIFLGNDRNNSQHYFYIKEPNRIYTRYKNYFLDDSPVYKVYESKQKIVEFLKSLNQKGIHEKHLHDSVNFLLKQDIIRNLTTEEELQQCMGKQGRMESQCVFIQSQQDFRLKIVKEILQMEESFSDYLAIKNYRWANDAKREEFKLGFPFIDDVQAMKQAIKNLQQNFLFVQVLREREESDSNEQNGQKQQGQRGLFRRKKPIRIWGINSERIKKFWLQYLQICIDYIGIWINVCILKNFVDKYLEKKYQHIRQQQRKQLIEQQKQEKRRLKQLKQMQIKQKNQKRLRQKDTTRKIAKYDQSQQQQIQEEVVQISKPRRSNLRSSSRLEQLRRRPMTIDSDEQIDEQVEQIEQQQQEELSADEDQCAICQEVGDMICCDTCPKVYHLECVKLKEVPEGEWSCMQCLQRFANQRQTRSRARRNGN